MPPPERPSPIWQSGEPLTFVSCDGSERTLLPEQTKWIGGGNYGEVFSVRGTLRQTERQPEHARVAIKQFVFRDTVENAVRKHDLLARLNLPVFGMYDAEKERNIIVMHNGNADRTLMVSQNESLARSALERHPLETIENADQLIADIIQTVRMATHFGVIVPNDAYLYSVRRSGTGGTVTYSLDDTDNVRTQREAGVGTAEVLAQNVRAVSDSLRDNCFGFAVREPASSAITDRLRAQLMKAREKIGEELNRAIEC